MPIKKATAPAPETETNPASPMSGRTWGAKKRQSRQNTSSVRRVLRIAEMAWQGRSAGEIADEMGVGTQHVYQLASDYRIKLVPKTRAEYSFRTTIQLKSLARLEAIAAEREDDVTSLVSRAIDALSREPTLLANLIDEE